jgi:hypothetical protein
MAIIQPCVALIKQYSAARFEGMMLRLESRCEVVLAKRRKEVSGQLRVRVSYQNCRAKIHNDDVVSGSRGRIYQHHFRLTMSCQLQRGSEQCSRSHHISARIYTFQHF